MITLLLVLFAAIAAADTADSSCPYCDEIDKAWNEIRDFLKIEPTPLNKFYYPGVGWVSESRYITQTVPTAGPTTGSCVAPNQCVSADSCNAVAKDGICYDGLFCCLADYIVEPSIVEPPQSPPPPVRDSYLIILQNKFQDSTTDIGFQFDSGKWKWKNTGETGGYNKQLYAVDVRPAGTTRLHPWYVTLLDTLKAVETDYDKGVDAIVSQAKDCSKSYGIEVAIGENLDHPFWTCVRVEAYKAEIKNAARKATFISNYY